MKAEKGKPIKITMANVCHRLHWHDSSTDLISYDEENQQLAISLGLCECYVNEIEDDGELWFDGQFGTLKFYGVTSFEIDVSLDKLQNSDIDLEFLVHNPIKQDQLIIGVELFGSVWGYDHDKRWNTISAFKMSVKADYATWQLCKTKEERFGADLTDD